MKKAVGQNLGCSETKVRTKSEFFSESTWALRHFYKIMSVGRITIKLEFCVEQNYAVREKYRPSETNKNEDIYHQDTCSAKKKKI